MRRKNIKVIATVLAAIMAISMAGCGKSTGNSEKTSKETKATTVAEQSNQSVDSGETLTLDVFSAQANYQGLQSGWYAKLLKDKFNIELNIIAPNVAGGGDTLYQTRSAAGNLGDIVILDNAKMKDCVDAGIVMDLTPYLEGKENIAKYQIGVDNLKEYIGKDGTYALPIDASTESPTKAALFGDKVQIASYMPFDYYEELGCPEIKDTNDLLDVLEQMQKNHPTTESGKKTYGFSLYKDWDGGYMALAERIALTNGYAATTESVFTNADATETQLLIDDNSAYHDALKLYFDANQRGLVDPDSSAQNFDSMFAKVKEKQVFYLWWAWMMGNYNTEEKGNKGDGYTYIPVGAQKIITDGYNPYGSGYSIGIGTNASDPERIMQFLDWTCSTEGINYYAGNIEGLTYEIVDGKQKQTDFGKYAWTDGSTVPEELGGGSFKDGYSQLNANIANKTDTNPDTGESYDVGLWETTLELGRTLLDDKWSETFGAKNQVEFLESHNMLSVIPGSAYTKPSESSEIQNMRTQCGTLIKETSWRMVFAKDEAEFNKLWEDLKAQLPGLGYDEVIAADKKIVEDCKKSRAESIAASK